MSSEVTPGTNPTAVPDRTGSFDIALSVDGQMTAQAMIFGTQLLIRKLSWLRRTATIVLIAFGLPFVIGIGAAVAVFLFFGPAFGGDGSRVDFLLVLPVAVIVLFVQNRFYFWVAEVIHRRETRLGPLRMQFDAEGFRYFGPGLDWRTDWTHVLGVIERKDMLILVTGGSFFPVPLADLLQEGAVRIKEWYEAGPGRSGVFA